MIRCSVVSALCALLVTAGASAFAQSTPALALLSELVYEVRAGQAPAGLPSAEWEFISGRTRRNGFKAMALRHRPTRRLVVALAGTETQAGDILQDLALVLRNDGELAARIQENLQRLVTQLFGKLGLGSLADDALRAIVEKLEVVDDAVRRALARARPLVDLVAKGRFQIEEAIKFTREAVERYVQRPRRERASTIEPIMTGHSLGGYLAQIVAARRRTEAVTFNAPGAHGEGPVAGSKLIRNHVREKDIVGTFGRHLGVVVYYPHERLVLDNHKMSLFRAMLDRGTQRTRLVVESQPMPKLK
jgi:hypothetical protein